MRAFGIVDNWYRFGIDLLPIDAKGALFRGTGARIDDWLGWEMPVRSPGAGVVAGVRDDLPDNPLGDESKRARRRLSEDPMVHDGNYVLIDHGRGEYSLVSHLRSGSATVTKGQRVIPGQIVAKVGNSGATPVPHLHYELRTGWGVKGVRSLPPYFHGVRPLGWDNRGRPIPVGTGDVLIAR